MAGRIVLAIGVFVIFGGVALAMGRSALNDWREGRRDSDAVTALSALEQWWPTLIAAAIAIAGPVIIVGQG